MIRNKKGYWVKGNEVIDVTYKSHDDFILDNPDDFGLTYDEAQEIYNSDVAKRKGKKRAGNKEALLKYAFGQGWIRVRHFKDKGMWIFYVDNYKLRKRDINNFIETMLFEPEELKNIDDEMYQADDVVILDDKGEEIRYTPIKKMFTESYKHNRVKMESYTPEGWREKKLFESQMNL